MISIVDNDENIRQALMGLVRSLGYKAATFCSAEEYLRSGRLRDTSCLITDVQMPGITGIELQERLARDGHTTKVIVITGLPDEELRRRALKAGAFGFLRKPFDEGRLIEYLDRAFGAAGAQPARA